MVLVVVSVAAFLASLDLFIVNIAFPVIRADFPGGDLAAMSWGAGASMINTARQIGTVLGTAVVDVDRGSRVTWHGPGQLVGYPVVALTLPLDVVDYMRRIEQGLIEVITDLGLPACRVPGRTGVWLPAVQTRRERKLAAAGVRIQRGVTTHGVLTQLRCRPERVPADRALRHR